MKTDKAKLRVIGGRKATGPQKSEDSRVAEVEGKDFNRILLASVWKGNPVFYLEWSENEGRKVNPFKKVKKPAIPTDE